ncbi:serine hydrolase [Enterococcus plantarum]|uniref:serine hydrolase domain-containing protein n=1 Tax=Enterococcus plantarum TaxID=1077675 RepID=UPI00084D189C|nr:serine hydrolase domain-containing protein [Enterococcus plantarum]OEG11118.1 serine hydrolase [Enterococcus plantarum]
MNLKQSIPSDFSGFVNVTSNNESLLFEAFGYRDLPNKLKNTVDTAFGTASGSKTFVAVAIMKLIEEKKIGIDQPINQIISKKMPNIDPNVTVHQLLNHTSGIGDYYDEEELNDYAELWEDYPNYKIRKNSALLPLFIDKKMVDTPGKKFQYNNTGYVLLATIIEELTRQNFDSYLKQVIFDPAGMTSTGYFALDRLPANTANAYIYDEESKEYYSNIYSIDVKGTGAGGCFTTLKDLERFWQTLLSGKILSTHAVNLMQTMQASDYYGYGFWIAKKNERTFPYMQGQDPGISFISSYDRSLNKTITIMSNLGQDVWALHKELSAVLL